MNEPNSALARIESRIDKTVSANTGLTPTGAMNFSSVEQIMEFAKVMAIAGVAVPKHLRENAGACLAVAIQASEWQMSPFAVASKTYVVNDRLAFEAQLVAAVILKRAPIVGRITYAHSGEGEKRRCKTTATLKDGGGTVEYESPEIGRIPVKNSPLWKGDPDQQLGYYSVRAMCRRHFPDVILGIYTPDEIEGSIDIQAQVTPISRGRVGAAVAAPPKTITEAAQQEREEEKPQDPVAPPVEPTPEPAKEPKGPSVKSLVSDLIEKARGINAGKGKLTSTLVEMKWIDEGVELASLSAERLAEIIDGWEEVKDRILNPEA